MAAKAAPNYRLKLRSGIYHVVWCEGHKPKRKSTGCRDEAGAYEVLNRMKIEADRPAHISNPTVRECLEAYKAKLLGNGCRSPHTLINSINQINKRLGSMQVNNIIQSDVDQYAKIRCTTGIKPSTVIRELGVLRWAMKHAHKMQWATPTFFSMPVRPGKPKSEWINKEQAKALREECKQTEHLYRYILLSIATGHRKQAVCELKWEARNDGDGWIDLVNRVIHLGQGYGNKHRSSVPIKSEATYQYLVAAKEADAKAWPFCNSVVHWRGDEVRDVKISLAKAAKRAGIPHFTAHMMRHSVVTWMVMDGVPYAEIAKYVGMSVDMVEKVYGHHHPDHLKAAASSVDLD